MRRGFAALAAIVIAVSLVGGVLAVVRAQSFAGPVERPAISLPPSSPTGVPSAEPTSAPSQDVDRPGPPARTVHVDDRYRDRYHGAYADWDALLADGRQLPTVSEGCRAAWQRTSRDAALDWGKAGFLCLDKLTGKGFKPQGVAGSGTTKGYRIGDRAARQRNIVLVSSYSAVAEKGLLFPHQPGKTETTRLTVIDLDHRRYNTVELVRPTGAGAFTTLDSHGSGLAWVGQYLYSSSRGSLWLYNVDDLLMINGRYVLPAVARWKVQGIGGLSSLGVDRSTSRARLTGINYNETGSAWSQSFALDATGLVRQPAGRAEQELNLIRAYGRVQAAVRSATSAPVPGTNYQGIGTAGRYRILNSSSLMLDGRRHGDNVVILNKNTMIARFSMPSENIESLYLDPSRSRYVTITEHGRQFLFWLPLDHLIDRAER